MKCCLVMIFILVYVSECKGIFIICVQMEIVCNTQTNDNINDRVPCSQVIFIMQIMPVNSPDQ